MEVVPILTWEKAIALREHLEHALTGECFAAIQQTLLDTKDQILLTKTGVILRAEGIGELTELRVRLALQLGDIHGRWRRREHASRIVRMKWRRNRRGCVREDRCGRRITIAPQRNEPSPSAADRRAGQKSCEAIGAAIEGQGWRAEQKSEMNVPKWPPVNVGHDESHLTLGRRELPQQGGVGVNAPDGAGRRSHASAPNVELIRKYGAFNL